MSHSKQELRREVLQRLKAAAKADPAQLRSARLRRELGKMLGGSAQCIALYAPLPHEVNLLPLLQEYPQHDYVFPLCQPGRQLEFRRVRNAATELVPGAMNIPEPAAHTLAVSPECIDILIVPGVAFTASGERLGYGGGYYDRFIPRCAQARLVALAFPEQLVDSIPTDEHDLRIPQLITALT